ncbi:tubulin beta [Clonorchis sinensis]|uniref:Tubulin beta n=1 Tax=Clonorchis sinensis TaxID=79923 RepID=G7YBX9_CLOSI|nr:tubulin beta [Clonorchis sinensis]
MREIFTIIFGHLRNPDDIELWKKVTKEHYTSEQGQWTGDCDETNIQLTSSELNFLKTEASGPFLLTSMNPWKLITVRNDANNELFHRICKTENKLTDRFSGSGKDVLKNTSKVIVAELKRMKELQNFQFVHCDGSFIGGVKDLLDKHTLLHPDKLSYESIKLPSTKITDILVGPFNSPLSLVHFLKFCEQISRVDCNTPASAYFKNNSESFHNVVCPVWYGKAGRLNLKVSKIPPSEFELKFSTLLEQVQRSPYHGCELLRVYIQRRSNGQQGMNCHTKLIPIRSESCSTWFQSDTHGAVGGNSNNREMTNAAALSSRLEENENDQLPMKVGWKRSLARRTPRPNEAHGAKSVHEIKTTSCQNQELPEVLDRLLKIFSDTNKSLPPSRRCQLFAHSSGILSNVDSDSGSLELRRMPSKPFAIRRTASEAYSSTSDWSLEIAPNELVNLKYAAHTSKRDRFSSPGKSDSDGVGHLSYASTSFHAVKVSTITGATGTRLVTGKGKKCPNTVIGTPRMLQPRRYSDLRPFIFGDMYDLVNVRNASLPPRNNLTRSRDKSVNGYAFSNFASKDPQRSAVFVQRLRRRLLFTPTDEQSFSRKHRRRMQRCIQNDSKCADVNNPDAEYEDVTDTFYGYSQSASEADTNKYDAASQERIKRILLKPTKRKRKRSSRASTVSVSISARTSFEQTTSGTVSSKVKETKRRAASVPCADVFNIYYNPIAKGVTPRRMPALEKQLRAYRTLDDLIYKSPRPLRRLTELDYLGIERTIKNLLKARTKGRKGRHSVGGTVIPPTHTPVSARFPSNKIPLSSSLVRVGSRENGKNRQGANADQDYLRINRASSVMPSCEEEQRLLRSSDKDPNNIPNEYEITEPQHISASYSDFAKDVVKSNEAEPYQAVVLTKTSSQETTNDNVPGSVLASQHEEEIVNLVPSLLPTDITSPRLEEDSRQVPTDDSDELHREESADTAQLIKESQPPGPRSLVEFSSDGSSKDVKEVHADVQQIQRPGGEILSISRVPVDGSDKHTPKGLNIAKQSEEHSDKKYKPMHLSDTKLSQSWERIATGTRESSIHTVGSKDNTVTSDWNDFSQPNLDKSDFFNSFDKPVDLETSDQTYASPRPTQLSEQLLLTSKELATTSIAMGLDKLYIEQKLSRISSSSWKSSSQRNTGRQISNGKYLLEFSTEIRPQPRFSDNNTNQQSPTTGKRRYSKPSSAKVGNQSARINGDEYLDNGATSVELIDDSQVPKALFMPQWHECDQLLPPSGNENGKQAVSQSTVQEAADQNKVPFAAMFQSTGQQSHPFPSSPQNSGTGHVSDVNVWITQHWPHLLVPAPVAPAIETPLSTVTAESPLMASDAHKRQHSMGQYVYPGIECMVNFTQDPTSGLGCPLRSDICVHHAPFIGQYVIGTATGVHTQKSSGGPSPTSSEPQQPNIHLAQRVVGDLYACPFGPFYSWIHIGPQGVSVISSVGQQTGLMPGELPSNWSQTVSKPEELINPNERQLLSEIPNHAATAAKDQSQDLQEDKQLDIDKSILTACSQSVHQYIKQNEADLSLIPEGPIHSANAYTNRPTRSQSKPAEGNSDKASKSSRFAKDSGGEKLLTKPVEDIAAAQLGLLNLQLNKGSPEVRGMRMSDGPPLPAERKLLKQSDSLDVQNPAGSLIDIMREMPTTRIDSIRLRAAVLSDLAITNAMQEQLLQDRNGLDVKKPDGSLIDTTNDIHNAKVHQQLSLDGLQRTRDVKPEPQTNEVHKKPVLHIQSSGAGETTHTSLSSPSVEAINDLVGQMFSRKFSSTEHHERKTSTSLMKTEYKMLKQKPTGAPATGERDLSERYRQVTQLQPTGNAVSIKSRYESLNQKPVDTITPEECDCLKQYRKIMRSHPIGSTSLMKARYKLLKQKTPDSLTSDEKEFLRQFKRLMKLASAGSVSSMETAHKLLQQNPTHALTSNEVHFLEDFKQMAQFDQTSTEAKPLVLKSSLPEAPSKEKIHKLTRLPSLSASEAHTSTSRKPDSTELLTSESLHPTSTSDANQAQTIDTPGTQDEVTYGVPKSGLSECQIWPCSLNLTPTGITKTKMHVSEDLMNTTLTLYKHNDYTGPPASDRYPAFIPCPCQSQYLESLIALNPLTMHFWPWHMNSTDAFSEDCGENVGSRRVELQLHAKDTPASSYPDASNNHRAFRTPEDIPSTLTSTGTMNFSNAESAAANEHTHNRSEKLRCVALCPNLLDQIWSPSSNIHQGTCKNRLGQEGRRMQAASGTCSQCFGTAPAEVQPGFTLESSVTGSHLPPQSSPVTFAGKQRLNFKANQRTSPTSFSLSSVDADSNFEDDFECTVNYMLPPY